MSELVCLELSILLWYAHVFTQGAFAGARSVFRIFLVPGTSSVNPKDSYFHGPPGHFATTWKTLPLLSQSTSV
jgi:hypothetical protein